VRLGILKNANGRIAELRIQLGYADRDFRDILASAEYPRGMAINPSEKDLSRLKKARMEDAYEFQEWVEKQEGEPSENNARDMT